MKQDIFASRLLSSRIQSESVTAKERALGYFAGPCLYSLASTALFGPLTQFYTDVLGISGGILTWLPLLTNITGSILGLFAGQWIDRTRTAQGKAHPWLLFFGLSMSVCGLLLYLIPREKGTLQNVWLLCSYLLCCGLVNTVCSLSRSLILPLSSRDPNQRDRLIQRSSVASSLIPGTLNALGMPFLIRAMGIGTAALTTWRSFMCCMAVLFIPAILLEYYFTRERIQEPPRDRVERSDLLQRLHACFSNRQWIVFLLFSVTLAFSNAFSGSSLVYYCNWVLGNSVRVGTQFQLYLNMAQVPMACGMFLIWPLARRYGKQQTAAVGFITAALSSLLLLFSASNLFLTVLGVFLRAAGTTATFLNASFQAGILDSIEDRSGFRADALSFSVMSVFQSTASGLGQTVFMWGIRACGYVTPESVTAAVDQPEAMRTFFTLCFAAVPALGFSFCALFMLLLRKIQR